MVRAPAQLDDEAGDGEVMTPAALLPPPSALQPPNVVPPPEPPSASSPTKPVAEDEDGEANKCSCCGDRGGDAWGVAAKGGVDGGRMTGTAAATPPMSPSTLTNWASAAARPLPYVVELELAPPLRNMVAKPPLARSGSFDDAGGGEGAGTLSRWPIPDRITCILGSLFCTSCTFGKLRGML
mmetsp:Transcript_30411/g.83544  ORF Transcript_30411/g.83544 Transcript_30411/m.83544 type:complete len:182 (+) Transcript_30411:605-1150(+)